MYRQSLNSTRYTPDQVVKTKTVFTLPLHYKETKSQCWSGRPLIFTSSLTDFFHEEIDSYRYEAWDIIRKCPHLIFQILTKRPERILSCLPDDWGDGWDNVWLGTSVGSYEGIKRVGKLIDVPAKVRFLSLEPMYEDLSEITQYFYPEEILHTEVEDYEDGDKHSILEQVIHWVIVGGESGNDTGKYKYRPCKLEWIEEIVKIGKYADVPVFVKQVGTHLSKKLGMSDRHGGDFNEFPQSIQYREFPHAK
jgi:protein gp37